MTATAFLLQNKIYQKTLSGISTCFNAAWVSVQVIRQHEAKKHGETQNKKISGGVQIHTL